MNPARWKTKNRGKVCQQTVWVSFYFDAFGHHKDDDGDCISNIGKLWTAAIDNPKKGIRKLYYPGLGKHFEPELALLAEMEAKKIAEEVKKAEEDKGKEALAKGSKEAAKEALDRKEGWWKRVENIEKKEAKKLYYQYKSQYAIVFNKTERNRYLRGIGRYWKNFAEDLIHHPGRSVNIVKKELFKQTVGHVSERWSFVRDAEWVAILFNTGVDTRLEAAIDDFKEAVATSKKKTKIKQINVAIFGADMGGALAVAFANKLLKDVCEKEKYDGMEVHVRFMGLFDCMSSRYDDNFLTGFVPLSNSVSGEQEYPDFGVRGKHYDKIHSKVIIVTHSQGSLVARYAMKVLGAEARVQGVVHMDQPTTGAPVLYRRFITGTSPERSLFDVVENVFGAILGGTSYHFTRMAAPLTGALSLLPTNDYIAKQGDDKHKWLNSPHPHLKFDKPVTDVYEDVYLSEKFGLINCKRYDAAGQPKPYREKEFEIVQYYDNTDYYSASVRIIRLPRHTFGDGPLPAGATILPPPEDNPYRLDNYRLKPHDGLDDISATTAEDFWNEFSIGIRKAKKFHADLGLAKHDDTHVVRSRDLDTVTQVTFNVNEQGVLDCPLVRAKDGDGTVPLTSQEALLHAGEKKQNRPARSFRAASTRRFARIPKA